MTLTLNNDIPTTVRKTAQLYEKDDAGNFASPRLHLYIINNICLESVWLRLQCQGRMYGLKNPFWGFGGDLLHIKSKTTRDSYFFKTFKLTIYEYN